MAIDAANFNLEEIVRHCPGLSIHNPPQLIGNGAQKAVWKCEYHSVPYALKVLSAAQTERARKELKLMGMCNSDCLPRTGPIGLTSLGSGSHSGDAVVYFLEELIDGPSLDKVIKPLPLHQVTLLALHVSKALHELATKGYLHRDVRQPNIRQRSRKAEFVLLDLGFALDFAAASITRLGGRLDLGADMFSLGMLLYECATGIHPFHSDTVLAADLEWSILRRPVEHSSTLNREIPDGFSQMILRLIGKPRSLRYAHTGELLHDLERLLGQFPSTASFKIDS